MERLRVALNSGVKREPKEINRPRWSVVWGDRRTEDAAGETA